MVDGATRANADKAWWREPFVWLLVVATFVAYGPAYGGGFVWDDDYYVSQNALLRAGDGWWRVWIPGATVQYYPAVFTSFWVEWRLWGADPTGYHATNVALHALAAALVWRAARVIGLPGAAFVAALFALHPVHVESVAWITERKNVLSAVLYLAAALVWWRFEEQCDERGVAGTVGVTNEHGSTARRTYLFATALFVLALLAKSVTCSLPAVLILVRLWRRRPVDRRFLAALAPWFAIGLALALHTAHVERVHVGATGDDFAFTLIERLEIATRALVFYATKLTWPEPLIFVYPRFELGGGLASWWPALVVCAVGAASVVAFARGVRGPALALAFFGGTLVPALGFFDVYPMRYSFVADHFQYLASLGVFALVAAGGVHFVRSEPMRRAGAGVVLTVLAVLTWRQCAQYADLETLWRTTIARNPAAWMAHGNLGELLGERGANDEALVHVEAALAACTSAAGSIDLRANRALLLGRLGRNSVALAELEAVHAARGGNELDVAAALERLGRDDEAEKWLRRAVASPAPRSDAPTRLAVHLLRRNRAVEAVDVLVRVVVARPDDLDARLFLVDAYAAAGRRADALSAAGTALEEARRRGESHLAGLIERRMLELRGR